MQNSIRIDGRCKSSALFYIFICCVISAVLYSVTENTLLSSFTGLLICYIVFVIPAEDCFVFVFGLQYLRTVIPIQVGSSPFGFILFAYIVLLIKNYIIRRTIIAEDLILLPVLVIDIASSALGGVFKIGDNINWIFSLGYNIFILKKYADKINFERMFLYFLIAQWVICIINILAEYRIFGRSLVPGMYGVWTNQLQAFAFGKAYSRIAGGNGISFNNSLAIALCVMLLPRTKKFKLKAFYLVSIAFLGYCGIMVISRGFYIELILFTALLLLSNITRPRQMLLYVCIIGVIILLVYYYAYDKLIVSFNRVFERFEAGNANREELISDGLELVNSNVQILLFGGGSYYPDIYSFTAHNLYLDSFVSLGIFGCIIYWGLIIKIILESLLKYVKKISLRALIPLIMLFAFKLISGSTRDIGFYYYISLTVIFAIYISGKDKINAKKGTDGINSHL